MSSEQKTSGHIWVATIAGIVAILGFFGVVVWTDLLPSRSDLGNAPESSEMERMYTERFFNDVSTDFVVIDKSECELTSNQKSEDGISERWIIRHSVTINGNYVPETAFTVQKNLSGNWEWYTKGSSCDRGY